MWKNTELYHYGVEGMRWGVRRYQNPDGSYTSLGKRRERKHYKAERKKIEAEITRDRKKALNEMRSLSDEELNARTNRLRKEKEFYNLNKDFNKDNSNDKISKVAKKYTGKELPALTAALLTGGASSFVAKSPLLEAAGEAFVGIVCATAVGLGVTTFLRNPKAAIAAGFVLSKASI